MIINHNCCIKLVLLVIFIYDARSHIRVHQIYKPSVSDMHMYVCKRSRHSLTLCEGRTNFGFSNKNSEISCNL